MAKSIPLVSRANVYRERQALTWGATENAAVAQALLDNLIGRGLDPKVCRLFVIDGARRGACLIADSKKGAFQSHPQDVRSPHTAMLF